MMNNCHTKIVIIILVTTLMIAGFLFGQPVGNCISIAEGIKVVEIPNDVTAQPTNLNNNMIGNNVKIAVCALCCMLCYLLCKTLKKRFNDTKIQKDMIEKLSLQFFDFFTTDIAVPLLKNGQDYNTARRYYCVLVYDMLFNYRSIESLEKVSADEVWEQCQDSYNILLHCLVNTEGKTRLKQNILNRYVELVNAILAQDGLRKKRFLFAQSLELFKQFCYDAKINFDEIVYFLDFDESDEGLHTNLRKNVRNH